MKRPWQEALRANFPHLDFLSQEPLAAYTTVAIGGPAELLWVAQSFEDLLAVLRFCQTDKIAYTLLGAGSNTLIADSGLKGLVVINRTRQIALLPLQVESAQLLQNWEVRWHTERAEETKKLFDYYDGQEPKQLVRLDAGTPLNYAFISLLAQGVTGLEFFTLIPATIGGAVYNNIHGAHRFFGEFVVSVEVLTPRGKLLNLSASRLEFAYDYSRFHQSGEVILRVTLCLPRGPVQKARQASQAWAQEKRSQPAHSLGCIFQNLSATEQTQAQLPSASVGYLIDRVLGLKGHRIGDAQISLHHAAFIENLGQATAKDYLALIRLVRQRARETLQLELRPEIFFRGFTKQELAEIEPTQKGER